MPARESKWLAALMTLFGRNWITLFGAVLAGVSGLLIIGFLLLGLLRMTDSPYVGIMAFLILPVVFVFGLLIIPVGAYWERRRAFRAHQEAVDLKVGQFPYPRIDLNKPHTRHVAGLVIVLTALNLLIVSTASYKGVTFMDSVAFCGKICHTVMEPQHTAYADSPHSRVKCVECHIGPGAPWFVRAKVSGLGQVLAVTFNTHARPIPTPVENLRPSQDTCEECHWPERFTGDRLKVIRKFLEDEANSLVQTVLLMHIGGGNSGGKGIHSWHIDPDKRTTYFTTDPKRQEIVRVRVEKSDGAVTEFVREDPEGAAEGPAHVEERVMDCIDCHNRPTHIFKMPDQAMDEALADGRIDRTLPYIKKLGTEVLAESTGAESDLDQIAERLRSYYQEHYSDLYESGRETIEDVVRAIQAIYSRNVFPTMKVTWGTYPDHIGHERFPGCFRCHADSLSTKDGETIAQDCDICHTVLAWDEENPEILQQLGVQ